MANAKKCDACGKLYEIYGVDDLSFAIFHGVNKPNAIDLMCIDEAGDGNCIEELELCPECMEKVQSLLKKIKEDYNGKTN